MAVRPLCFVLMPFGRKPAPGGSFVDFDAVYRDLIAPAIAAADLEPLRADEEQAGGIIHKPMFERLILCEYAVADLTTANANVFYELGLRHAVKPYTTALLFAASGGPLPFDVNLLRGLPYTLGADGRPARAEDDRRVLAERLVAARAGLADSPVFQLVDGFPDLQRLKTDVFRERVAYSRQIKDRLAAARASGVEAVRKIERELTDPDSALRDVEAGVLVDLFLSYRSVSAWTEMIDLAGRLPGPLAATTLVREQLALALNRSGDSEGAERVLSELLASRGPSSETCGILGRVYKDRWERARRNGELVTARGLLTRAISAYLKGFESDWRDAYPGVNAVTLMELADPPDPRRLALIPVVAYAVERRIAAGQPDYWDYATRLELAVLAKDEAGGGAALGDALAILRERWEAETTARNLRLIREARAARGESVPWADALERELDRAGRV
jgi:hypothetical protein